MLLVRSLGVPMDLILFICLISWNSPRFQDLFSSQDFLLLLSGLHVSSQYRFFFSRMHLLFFPDQYPTVFPVWKVYIQKHSKWSPPIWWSFFHVCLLTGGIRMCHLCLDQKLLNFTVSLYQLQLASSRLLELRSPFSDISLKQTCTQLSASVGFLNLSCFFFAYNRIIILKKRNI